MEELKAAGNAAYIAKDFEGAVKHYTGAIETDEGKDNHLLYSNRCAALIALNRFHEAKSDGEMCIKLDSTFLKGYLRLATALRGLGDKEGALQVAKEGALQGDRNKEAVKAKGGPDVDAEAKKVTVGLADLQILVENIMDEMSTAKGNNKSIVNNISQADQDLYQEYTAAALGVQQTSNELQSTTRGIRAKELALSQIEMYGENAVTYQAIGRIFLQKSSAQVKESIKQDIKIGNEAVENLTKKMRFHEKKALDLKNELEASMKKAQKA